MKGERDNYAFIKYNWTVLSHYKLNNNNWL